ncbi:digestive cysteine proteinase 2-like isoform X1 [Homarus americanus]|uniref:digestive cysteine proteinase 2-like isoform X1 n=1 Tax=Homarus americanus TaxID=6706 RepID=UPI001C44210B|nr:digestive cysteine proteinase 2-like isoform X1 [Homarus americanus]
MKVTTLVVCWVVVVAASPPPTSWELFKVQYGRQYVDVKEEEYRQQVFEHNQQYIEDFNERFERGEVTFSLKMNQFGDKTHEEFKAIIMGHKAERGRGPPLAPRTPLHQDEHLPQEAEVDWRNKGAVTPVSDQGASGASWSFSATGSLEGQQFVKAGTLMDLSEQQLVDCMDDYFPGVFEAFTYVKDNGGIDTEAGYPDQPSVSQRNDGTCHYTEEAIGAQCTGYVQIEEFSESELQKAVRDVGPVSVEVDASQMSFQFYSSGVYYDPKCMSRSPNHAMLTVGYGTTGDQDYWIVKNSWGAAWGEQGYINMARNRGNNCGIATLASYPLV